MGVVGLQRQRRLQPDHHGDGLVGRQVVEEAVVVPECLGNVGTAVAGRWVEALPQHDAAEVADRRDDLAQDLVLRAEPGEVDDGLLERVGPPHRAVPSVAQEDRDADRPVAGPHGPVQHDVGAGASCGPHRVRAGVRGAFLEQRAHDPQTGEPREDLDQRLAQPDRHTTVDAGGAMAELDDRQDGPGGPRRAGARRGCRCRRCRRVAAEGRGVLAPRDREVDRVTRALVGVVPLEQLPCATGLDASAGVGARVHGGRSAERGAGDDPFVEQVPPACDALGHGEGQQLPAPRRVAERPARQDPLERLDDHRFIERHRTSPGRLQRRSGPPS